MSHSAFGGLPYVPMREHWVCESRAFLSGDARLVRACVRLLMAAWRGVPAGTVNPAYGNLSAITGLTEQELAVHYAEITDGWELRDGRLLHLEMHALCDRLQQRHADTVAHIAEDAALAMQDSSQFTLQSPVAIPHKGRGARHIPNNWAPRPETVARLEQLGFTGETRDVLVQTMTSWARSRNEKRADWDETLIGFALKERKENPLVRGAHGAGAGRFGGLVAVSRGDVATAQNIERFMSGSRS